MPLSCSEVLEACLRFAPDWSICGKLYTRFRAKICSLWPWQSISPHVRDAICLSCALQWWRKKGLFSQQSRRQGLELQSIFCCQIESTEALCCRRQ